ncbi:MAG: mechanosensitive ion channel family protein [Stackebrandtia sp.]
MDDITPIVLLPAIAISVALIVSAARLVLRLLLRKSPRLLEALQWIHRPVQVMLALGAARAGVEVARDFEWRQVAAHVLLLGTLAATAWLATRLIHILRNTVEHKYDGAEELDAHHRHRRTQAMLIYRAAYVLIWTIAVGIGFLTFPGARTIGTSVLASAGVAGVIVGFAAQTMLKNLFAGLGLAFGDTLRLGDVVEIEGEWGRIEDIALSYVVVKIWDERRLILPTSYFNDKPFRNWSRESPDVQGTIELDVDWRLPADPLRDELYRIVSASPHWDGRKCDLVVTEATGPLKRLRPRVSAADGGTLWDLRCEVREKLIDWIVIHYPDCMPQLRVETPDRQRESRITAILPVQGGPRAAENRQPEIDNPETST